MREKEKGWKGGRVEGGEGRIHVKSTSKLHYQTCQYTQKWENCYNNRQVDKYI